MEWSAVIVLTRNLLLQLVAVPVATACLVIWFNRLVRCPCLPFFQTWKCSATAVIYGVILAVALRFLLPLDRMEIGEAVIIQAGSSCLTQFTVLTLMFL